MKIKSLFSLKKWIMYYLGKPSARNLSDEKYIKLKFYASLGEKLNLDNPKTFNEKLQWLKLYDRNPKYTKMVDKYEAKKYVADIIGEEYIIPTLGVWDNFDMIDFDSLPNGFVLKSTHDSGGLVICKDKKDFNKSVAKAKIERSLKRDYYLVHREWPYKDVPKRIVAEQYIEECDGANLIDYKFYCFNGKPKFLYVSQGLSNHQTAHINYVSLDWKKTKFKRNDFDEFEELPPKPLNFDKMIECSQKLSHNIPFLRVDFYNLNGKIYFSELTFFPGAGFTEFHPPEWDEIIGEWINLPDKTV